MDKLILYILSNSNTSNLIIDHTKNIIGFDNKQLVSTSNKNKLTKILGSFTNNNNKFFFKNYDKKAWFKYTGEKTQLIKGTIILIGKTHLYISQIVPTLVLQNIKSNEIIKVNQIATIGRHSKNNIIINDPNISKHHAVIFMENNTFFIKDTNSSNGIVILPNKQPYPITYDTYFQVGGTSGIISKYQYGVFHDIGRRHTFEDTYQVINQLKLNKQYNNQISYFAVFDGHSGKETSTYAQMYLHKEIETELNKINKNITDNTIKRSIINSILSVDKTIFTNKIPSGTTANICIIYNNKLFTANVGDSRSVLSRNGKAISLSYDHKPSNKHEMKRIQNSTGFVHNGRVNGKLAVSRALGDNTLKHRNPKLSPLTANPDITINILTSKDEFIVMACDGLWDVMNNQDVVDFIRLRLHKKQDLQLISKNIVNHAINTLGSGDNVTCLIIKI